MPIKAIILAKRRSDLTPEQFRKQYDEHVELGRKQFGHLWLSYKRNFLGPATYLDAAWPLPETPPAAPYDAVAELVYRDQAALEEQGRLARDPDIARRTIEDEMRTFDRSATCISFCEVVKTDLGTS